MSLEPGIVALVAGIVLLVAVILVVGRLRGKAVIAPATVPAPPPVAPATATGLVAELEVLQQAGQWDTLLRQLDATLPEWPVSSSLIEVARAAGNLDHDLGLLPRDAVTSVVTQRLQAQTDAVSGNLWRLADRLVLADRMRGADLQEWLQQEDEVLLRLLPAIRAAQAELTQLTLGGDTAMALQRAEGRFLALADTAKELQALK